MTFLFIYLIQNVTPNKKVIFKENLIVEKIDSKNEKIVILNKGNKDVIISKINSLNCDFENVENNIVEKNQKLIGKAYGDNCNKGKITYIEINTKNKNIFNSKIIII